MRVAGELVLREHRGHAVRVVRLGHLADCIFAVLVELDSVAVRAPLCVEHDDVAVLLGEVQHLLAILVPVAGAVPLCAPVHEVVSVALELVSREPLLEAVFERLVGHGPAGRPVPVELDRVGVRAPLRVEVHKVLVLGRDSRPHGRVGVRVARAVGLGVPACERVREARVLVLDQSLRRAIDELLGYDPRRGHVAAVRVEHDCERVAVPLCVQLDDGTVLRRQVHDHLAVFVAVAGAVLLGVPPQELLAVNGKQVLGEALRDAYLERLVLHVPLSAVRVEGDVVDVGPPLRVQRDKVVRLGDHLGANRPVGIRVAGAGRLRVPLHERVSGALERIGGKPLRCAERVVRVGHRPSGLVAVRVEPDSVLVGLPLRVERDWGAILSDQVLDFLHVGVGVAGAVPDRVPPSEGVAAAHEQVGGKRLLPVVLELLVGHRPGSSVPAELYDVLLGSPLGVEDVRRREVDDFGLVRVGDSLAGRLGVPPREFMVLARELVRRQVRRLVVLAFERLHFAFAAVGFEQDVVVARLPDGV